MEQNDYKAKYESLLQLEIKQRQAQVELSADMAIYKSRVNDLERQCDRQKEQLTTQHKQNAKHRQTILDLEAEAAILKSQVQDMNSVKTGNKGSGSVKAGNQNGMNSVKAGNQNGMQEEYLRIKQQMLEHQATALIDQSYKKDLFKKNTDLRQQVNDNYSEKCIFESRINDLNKQSLKQRQQIIDQESKAMIQESRIQDLNKQSLRQRQKIIDQESQVMIYESRLKDMGGEDQPSGKGQNRNGLAGQLEEELQQQKDFSEKLVEEKQKAQKDTEELKNVIVNMHEIRVTLNTLFAPMKKPVHQTQVQNQQQFWNQDYKRGSHSQNRHNGHSVPNQYKHQMMPHSQVDNEYGGRSGYVKQKAMNMGYAPRSRHRY